MASAVAGSSTADATGRTAWARNLGAPVRDFLSTETGGAVVLVGAALAALAWANSPWPHSYQSFWDTRLAFSAGSHVLSATLRQWVNEGLMALFFLVVGLEAKREPRSRRVAPAQPDRDPGPRRARGHGAVRRRLPGDQPRRQRRAGLGDGDVHRHGPRPGSARAVAPSGATRLRVFLLTLAVVDDFLALIVIALAYSTHVSLLALAIALVLFAVLVLLRFAARWREPAAVIVGIGVWLAMFESGIDPVVAGLAIGLVTSAYPPARDDLERATELTRSFREQPTPELAYIAQRGLTATISPNERLQYRLHPWASFLVVPLFALANAGIHMDGRVLSDAVSSPVTIGIVLGYLLGKPLGILGASWLASRRALGGARLSVTWPGLAGTAAVAGTGFTVSLLIAGRAFGGGELLDQATLGILAAAILSSLLAWIVFAVIARMPASVRARQLGATAEQLIDLAEDVDPARDHIRGAPDAPVTLVEYGDFECPYCGRAEPAIRELLADWGDDLRYVFRHLPLSDVHPWAQLAAEAAEAAGAQGKFWEMHDLLLAHQGELTPGHLRRYAQELGLDVERFAEELRRRVHAARVGEDVASADASGVSGTPSFFINGRRHNGVYDVDTLSAAVRAARSRVSK